MNNPFRQLSEELMCLILRFLLTHPNLHITEQEQEQVVQAVFATTMTCTEHKKYMCRILNHQIRKEKPNPLSIIVWRAKSMNMLNNMSEPGEVYVLNTYVQKMIWDDEGGTLRKGLTDAIQNVRSFPNRVKTIAATEGFIAFFCEEGLSYVGSLHYGAEKTVKDVRTTLTPVELGPKCTGVEDVTAMRDNIALVARGKLFTWPPQTCGSEEEARFPQPVLDEDTEEQTGHVIGVGAQQCGLVVLAVNPNTGHVEIKSVGKTEISPGGKGYIPTACIIDEYSRGDFPVDLLPDAVRQFIVGSRAVYIITHDGTLWTISNSDVMGLCCRGSWYGNDCLMPAKYPPTPVVHAFLGEEQAVIVSNNPVDNTTAYHAVGSTLCMPGRFDLKYKPSERMRPSPLKTWEQFHGIIKTMCFSKGYNDVCSHRYHMVHVVDEKGCVWQCGEFGGAEMLLSVDEKGCIWQHDGYGEEKMFSSEKSTTALFPCRHGAFAIISPAK